jgi:hypothetical protein
VAVLKLSWEAELVPIRDLLLLVLAEVLFLQTRFWPLDQNFRNVPITLRFVPLNVVNLYGLSKSTLERPA